MLYTRENPVTDKSGAPSERLPAWVKPYVRQPQSR